MKPPTYLDFVRTPERDTEDTIAYRVVLDRAAALRAQADALEALAAELRDHADTLPPLSIDFGR